MTKTKNIVTSDLANELQDAIAALDAAHDFYRGCEADSLASPAALEAVAWAANRVASACTELQSAHLRDINAWKEATQ